jgi:hypothetical protein
LNIHLYVPDARNIFDDFVDQIIDLKKQGAATIDLEAQIDQMVYQLYGLSDEEIAIVEGCRLDADKEVEYNTPMEQAQ